VSSQTPLGWLLKQVQLVAAQLMLVRWIALVLTECIF
jgi:hypothetical protein